MTSASLARPQITVCNLQKITSFEKDDVLYKVVDGEICKYLVMAIRGENRVKLRAFQKSGELSNNTFEIQDNELDMYKVDTAHTKLRKAFFDLVRNNAGQQLS